MGIVFLGDSCLEFFRSVFDASRGINSKYVFLKQWLMNETVFRVFYGRTGRNKAKLNFYKDSLLEVNHIGAP